MIDAVKSEILLFFAAVGLAFSIFQGFEPFLEFCQWVQPFVYYWRFYTYKFWEYVLFFFPFSIPYNMADFLTFVLFVFFMGIRARSSVHEVISSGVVDVSEYVESVYSTFYQRTYLIPLSFVSVFVVLPVVGWSPPEPLFVRPESFSDRLSQAVEKAYFYAPVVIKCLMVLVFVGYFELCNFISANSDNQKVWKSHFSKYLWTVSTIILSLASLNFIGLYADDIRSVNLPPVPKL